MASKYIKRKTINDDVNKMNTDAKTVNSLTKEDLEIKKLRMEVSILQKQIDDQTPKKIGFFNELYNGFKNNLGKISAVLILVGGVVTPVLNYYTTQRKAYLVNVNSEVLKILNDSIENFTPVQLETISTQDPGVVAPYLLQLLSDHKINFEKAVQVYERMYKLNKENSNYTFADKILFYIFKDNKSILEDELSKNASIEFAKNLNDDETELTFKTYIRIIRDLQLGMKKDFKKAMGILLNKCGNNKYYANLCDYINTK